MKDRPNEPPLIVTDHEFHKYVFSPALNAGLKYGKAENVTFERLKADLLQNKQNRENLKAIAGALCEFPPDNHQ